MNWTNETEFKQLFEAYYNILCNYANTILRNEMDAEDVVLEVFVNFWNKRAELSIETGKLKSYLFRAVKNGAFGLIRSGKIREEHEEYYTAVLSQNEVDPSLAEDLFVLRELLKRSVRQLSPKSKEVYLLRTENGLTFAEIAETLNISRRTAENHMAGAITKLRDIIKEAQKKYQE